MAFVGIHRGSFVFDGSQWYLMVFNGFCRDFLGFVGLQGFVFYLMVLDGIGWHSLQCIGVCNALVFDGIQ